MSSRVSHAGQGHRFAPFPLLSALVLHGAAVALLVAMAPPQRPDDTSPALSFRVIQTPRAFEPETPELVARPRPAAQPASRAQPTRPSAPLLSAPAEAQVPLEEALPPAEPVADPASVADTDPVMPPRPAVSAAAAQVQTVPRFDADYLDNPPPAYPALSRRMGEEGKVVLRVFVEPSGRPGQIQIHSGSGSARLDQAAQDSVARWKFVPAERGGEPVGAWVLVPIQFSLRS